MVLAYTRWKVESNIGFAFIRAWYLGLVARVEKSVRLLR